MKTPTVKQQIEVVKIKLSEIVELLIYEEKQKQLLTKNKNNGSHRSNSITY